MVKEKITPVEGEVLADQPPEETSKKEDQPVQALAVVDSVSAVAGVGISTADLKKALKMQTDQRALIADFIKKHLVAGVDYLQIHVVKDCPNEARQRGSCKNKNHYSKKILAKPGQEKIFSLFSLTNKLFKDEETIDMLGGTKGLVAFKCLVYRGLEVVAEGRGAAVVGDNRRDVNATIKIAEKRARMDACLSLGFSEYFAQDLDDPDYQVQKKMAEEQAAGNASDGTGLPYRPKTAPIDAVERQYLAKLLITAGFTKDDQLELLRINGIADPQKMTSGEARDMILKMKNNAFAVPNVKTDTVLDDIDDNLDPEVAIAAAEKRAEDERLAELAKEPELVVDDELKKTVLEMADSIALNNFGKSWLMKMVCGRPIAKWESLTEDNWRRAYELVTSILEGKLTVEDHHILGYVADSGEPEQKELLSDEGGPSNEKAKPESNVGV